MALNNSAAVDTGDMAAEDVAALFGTTAGFKASEPNVTTTVNDTEDDF